MNTSKTTKLALAAVFCALVFVMTWIAIPTPSVGNVNLGDCMIILSALVLGNSYAIFASAIGATLCDMAAGYGVYMPATFIIKALMVMVILIMKKHLFKADKYISIIVPAICAELVMVAGYFIYEATALGYGFGAIMNVPFNLIQGTINLVVAVVLFAMLKKIGVIKK